MFGNRNFTQGVSSEVSIEIQLILWVMIDDLILTDIEIDYLQVFRLSNQDGQQKIVHSQEQPHYKNEVFILAENPVSAKIFVIDNGEYTTMMLAEEY